MLIKMRPAPVLESILDFERNLDGMFDHVLRQVPVRTNVPRMDVAERGNETVVVLELPGVKKEDLSITVKEGFLTISGERKTLEASEKSVLVRSEIPRGKFSRTIELPHEVDLNAVTAELLNGVLQVVLPKSPEARPREITVK